MAHDAAWCSVSGGTSVLCFACERPGSAHRRCFSDARGWANRNVILAPPAAVGAGELFERGASWRAWIACFGTSLEVSVTVAGSTVVVAVPVAAVVLRDTGARGRGLSGARRGCRRRRRI